MKGAGAGWLTRACSSTIGKKLIMAITGLGLCGFLVVHLAGNLLLYVGPEQYDHYAHALHAQVILLKVAEVGLLVLFLGHIYLAVTTERDNSAARPAGYSIKQSKQPPSGLAAPASSVMFITGIVVLLFILLHLADFKGLREHPIPEPPATAEVEESTPATAKPTTYPFAKAVAILRDPLSAIVYLVGSLVLGYHVLHGFQSAFQTLGFNHPKYTPIIKVLGYLFAITVAAGFGSFPLWAWAFHK